MTVEIAEPWGYVSYEPQEVEQGTPAQYSLFSNKLPINFLGSFVAG